MLVLILLLFLSIPGVLTIGSFFVDHPKLKLIILTIAALLFTLVCLASASTLLEPDNPEEKFDFYTQNVGLGYTLFASIALNIISTYMYLFVKNTRRTATLLLAVSYVIPILVSMAAS